MNRRVRRGNSKGTVYFGKEHGKIELGEDKVKEKDR